jgi:hypothetical protein
MKHDVAIRRIARCESAKFEAAQNLKLRKLATLFRGRKKSEETPLKLASPGFANQLERAPSSR